MLNSPDNTLESDLRAALPPEVFRDQAQYYLEEPRGLYQGRAALILAPSSVEETSIILAKANAACCPVVPYAGGTGLVGGQVKPDGPAPILLSMERMTKIRAVFPEENVIQVEAGCILADVQTAALNEDRLFPLSLASEGSARIGGLLGTNAGGVNVLRYGNARDLCLGLEVVLPDGQIWHGLRRLHKDNTGYDLRNLMIGSEGTLGVITAASLKLYSNPKEVGTALMVVPSPKAALDLLAVARDQIGDGISAFELIAGQGLQFLSETMPHVRQPFEATPDWAVLIDLGLTQDQDASQKLESLFEAGMDNELVSDGMIAQSQGQRIDFWNIRESIPEANRHVGAISSHDISIPLGKIAEFIQTAGQATQEIGDFRTNCFGHLGDGNLHYNLFPASGKSKADHLGGKVEIQHLIHQLVVKFDGSISAEHGVGRMKAKDLEEFGDPVKLATMRAIKNALDPNGIMNPGVIFPE